MNFKLAYWHHACGSLPQKGRAHCQDQTMNFKHTAVAASPHGIVRRGVRRPTKCAKNLGLDEGRIFLVHHPDVVVLGVVRLLLRPNRGMQV